MVRAVRFCRMRGACGGFGGCKTSKTPQARNLQPLYRGIQPKALLGGNWSCSSIASETSNSSEGYRSADSLATIRWGVGLQKKPGGGQRPIKKLSELPANVWTAAPNDDRGIQYFTRGSLGGEIRPIMCDTGSGVNSIPEDVLVARASLDPSGPLAHSPTTVEAHSNLATD